MQPCNSSLVAKSKRGPSTTDLPGSTNRRPGNPATRPAHTPREEKGGRDSARNDNERQKRPPKNQGGRYECNPSFVQRPSLGEIWT